MTETPRVYSFGPFRLDTIRRVVELAGEQGAAVDLTNLEYALLHAIVAAIWASPEKKVTDRQLCARVWPHEKDPGPQDNRLSVHTGHINKKLGAPYIKRNQREGYVLTLRVVDSTPADSGMLVAVRILFVSVIATMAAVFTTMTLRAILARLHATLTQASDVGPARMVLGGNRVAGREPLHCGRACLFVVRGAEVPPLANPIPQDAGGRQRRNLRSLRRADQQPGVTVCPRT